MKNRLILFTSLGLLTFLLSIYGTQSTEQITQSVSAENLSFKTEPVQNTLYQDDSVLLLLNKDHFLPEDYKPDLDYLDNGMQFDKRGIAQLNAMIKDAKKQGLSPVICSAYRSIERQAQLYEQAVKKQMRKGLSKEKAETEAAKSVAYPRTSEHNAGLAVDIVSDRNSALNSSQENTPEWKWLITHCSEYGFILRYPKNKTHITNIIYEPWHFRYVGVKAAKEIMEKQLCLEEYL